jgi:hypothetical protein
MRIEEMIGEVPDHAAPLYAPVRSKTATSGLAFDSFRLKDERPLFAWSDQEQQWVAVEIRRL